MQTYDDYCKELKKFGVDPISEEVWNRSYAPQKVVETLVIVPKRDEKKVAASLDNFIKAAESSKRRRAKSPPKSKAVSPQKNKTIKPTKTDRVMGPKTSLKGMTDEEKREHKRKLNRAWKAKKKPPSEKKPPLTLEEKRAKGRERYHKNKKPITRIFYKDLTEEELKAHLKEQRRLHTIKTKEKRKAYREANKEKFREYNREWNEKNKEKRKAISQRSNAKRRGKRSNFSQSDSHEEALKPKG